MNDNNCVRVNRSDFLNERTAFEEQSHVVPIAKSSIHRTDEGILSTETIRKIK
jgi:hypothetical protein